MKFIKQSFVLFGLVCGAASFAQQQPPVGPKAPAQNGSPTQIGSSPQSAAPIIPPLPANVEKPVTNGLTLEEFKAMLGRTMPLSEGQVKEVTKQTQVIKRAREAHVGPAPMPVSVSARVSLNAGSDPHVLRLNVDTVTTIVFTDITGAPWNVVNVVPGGKGLLEIPPARADAKTHMFTITPLDDYINTNIAVFLEGAPAPVMLSVVTNQAYVDFRVDLSVQARGPGAVMPAISRGLSDSVPAELISMVSGIAPSNARALKVVSSDVSDVQAWAIGSRMYVRTKATILSPAVPKDGKVATGSDGTKVYELPISPEVRLMSEGNIGRLQLGGFAAPVFTMPGTK
jgi:intracellular multiplication protein IcmK